MMRKLALCLVACVLWAQPVSAQIAFGNIGASSAGTTSISVAAPASISAGNILVICLAGREAPDGPPSGYTLVGTISGGSGVNGADTGTVYATAYIKVAVGGEGAETVNIAGGTGTGGRMIRYTKTLATWDVGGSKGSDNTAGTAWSVTGDFDEGVASGDWVIGCSAQNTDLYTNSSPSMSQSGVTFGTNQERVETTSALGNDSTVIITEHIATAGASAGVPTFTMTASGTAADNPAGATVMVRLREAEAGGTCTGGLMLLGAGKCE
jgi:MSHA biogenesis protein MshQ